MNAVEFADAVRPEETIPSPVIEVLDRPRQTALTRKCDARVGYALLAVIVLFAAWVTFAINNRLDEINAHLEETATTLSIQPLK